MVISQLKDKVSRIISKHDTQLLITSELAISITDYTLKSTYEVSDEVADKIISKATRIKNGEPLQYVTGSTEFMSLPFETKPGVLIPRADTEILVEEVIKTIADKKLSVLEIGAGSGCISVSIKNYCKNCQVTAIDISDTALQVAKSNAELNKTDVTIYKMDIQNEMPSDKFDIIVSNPPYIPTSVIDALDNNVKDYEPILALDGGTDGLDFYRRIISIAPHCLNKRGYIFFEVGHDQARAVEELIKSSFENADVSIVCDLCGIERVVYAKIE